MSASIFRIGFYSGIAAFTATVAFVIAQLLQLTGWLTFPWDEVLIYGFSLAIVIPFQMEMLALHEVTPPERKYWSHAALIFSVVYAVFVTANYVVQLATVLPMKLSGRSGEIQLLEQTPHSLFWDFDAIGYIFMGLATAIAVPVFKGERRAQGVRYAFIANALVTPLITYVYFYPVFSERLLLLGLPWGITAPMAMLMLALWFRKEEKGKL